jgi:serine/threonine protein kinase
MTPIDPDLWARADALFQEALELPSGERAAFVARACAKDEPLASAVRALLAADGSAGGILDAPVGDLAAAIISPDAADAAHAPANDPMIGRTIGRFRVLSRLGEGGMGIVYEAEQEEPRRRVALKVMRGGWGDDAEGLRFFRREAQTLARLQHPGIAAIHEAGRTDDGRPYFAMELVRGVPLDRAFAPAGEDARGDQRGEAEGAAAATAPAATTLRAVANAVELRARLDLVLEVCDAVIYAHQRGVIHRDLKPSNILVAPEVVSAGASARMTGASRSSSHAEPSTSSPSTTATRAPRVKVVDFGLARITDSEGSIAASRTEPRALQGTLPYMSPEQTTANPEEIDFRSDVYSLGVILYRLLTGEPPYVVRADALLEAVRTIREQAPRRAGAAAPLLRGDVETILAKALEKEPDRRYQSVAALAEDIRRFVSDQPILARPASAAYQLRKLAARHRAAAALLAVLGAVLVIATVALSVLYQSQRVATGRAQVEAQKAERINAFLQDMLASADPERAQGRDVTVEMMLDEAASRVDTSFTKEPEVQAELRRTLGKTYAALGRLQPAEEQLRRAIETRRALHGAGHQEVARSLGDLATILNTKGAYAEAESVTREALAIVKARTPGDAEEARHLDVLGFTAKRDGRYAESESLYMSALAIEHRLYGRANPSISTTLGGLASLYEIQGKFTAAESLYHEMQAIEKEVLGDDHPSHAVTVNNLAVLLDKQGRYAEAESLYRVAIARGRVLYGGPHPLLASRLFNLATTLRKMGRYDEAIAAHEEALAMQRVVYGAEHQGIARGLAALAMSLSLSSRHAEAESLALEALAMRKRLYRPGHDEITRSVLALAQVTRRAGRPAEAARLFREALDGLTAVFGAEHRDVVVAVQGLADAELDLRHHAAAESLYLEALRVRRKLEGSDHPLVAGVLWGLGKMKAQLGDSAAAEPLLREALDIWTEKLPPADTRISDAALALSRVLASANRGAEAESVITRRYDVVKALSSPPADDAARLLERLAELRGPSRD